ncbi:hypothetical protein ACH5RR_026273 [Cinchona calisaya]|uniref:Uncharacterized protein n=1 Tax=Cinchona calisaya TaxID=153742 RepID=A0ABD2Z2D5_9GENT
MLLLKDFEELNTSVLVRDGKTCFWFEHWDESNPVQINDIPKADLRINQAQTRNTLDDQAITTLCPTYPIEHIVGKELFSRKVD